MGRPLLERETELALLRAAAADAADGGGSVVLVTGEAGIGKTSLIRAFAAEIAPPTQVRAGACDDLHAGRTLGPWRDIARSTGGPLARALFTDTTDALFDAIVDELSSGPPTVLLVEDVHWADDATLDVMRYLVRRIEQLPAVLVLTARNEVRPPGHPLQQLLAALATVPGRRIELAPLTPAAVATLARGTGREAQSLHRMTLGNPFYVTEVLAAPADAVPVTVTDTILARLHQVPDSTRAVLEQLSVIPTVVESDLVAALVAGQVDALDDAEARGMIELQLGGVVFRHELARRAIEYSLTTYRRRAYNQAVVRALTARPELDLDRIVHHAIEAVDAETVARYAPRAGREASQAGSHRQALAQLEAALRFAAWLPDVERARVLDDYAWELYNAHRFDEAVAAGRESVHRYEALGDRLALGEALVRLSRHVYMTGRTDEAEAAALRAVEVLEDSGSTAALAHAVTYQGAMLALTGRSADALAVLDRAHKLALEADRLDLVALGLNYVGVARCDLEGADGIESLRESLVLATNRGYHEYAARAYTNLAEVLYRFGRLAELASCLDDGLGFVEERGFWSHAYNLHVHRALLLARGGNWDAAEAGLRELVDGVDEPGMLYVYSVPPYARLLARRGDPRAGPLLRRAWRRAMKQKSLLGIAYAGIGYVEWAWLTGQAELIPPVRDAVLARTASAGTAPLRAELLRYAARAGVGPVPDRPVPEDGGPFAVGLSGDWRAAAAMWDAIGDRYEQAIELADSGEVAATLDGLRYLDGLGAAATATIVRRRLRELGVRSVPRGPIAATQANPAGLTDRQLQVLTLMCAGRTNTDIAADLVLSVRTVDHHVAAVLGKLGAHSRHEAVELARLAGVGE